MSDPSTESESSKPQKGRAKIASHAKKMRQRLWVLVIALSIGLASFIGWIVLKENTDEVDRVYGQTLSATVSAVGKAFGEVFGGLELQDHPYGLRAYKSDLDVWVPIDPQQLMNTSDSGSNPQAVLLVHGLDEPGGIWDQLAPRLSQAGHVVIRFDYANDQSIVDSASTLIDALESLKARSLVDSQSLELDIVCHSMGGLVSFDAMTRDEFDGLNIELGQFITIGTPFGGSPWARLRAVAEIREQVQRWVESDDFNPKRLLGFAKDGVGEAGDDLLPGSEFLIDLNNRTIPDGLRVTCIVGKTLPSGNELHMMFASGALNDLVGNRDAQVLEREIHRLSEELGDGVVPMSSAVLKGADEVVTLSANHRALVRNVELGEAIRQFNGLEPSQEPPAIQVVIDRLSESSDD
ncbi:MAG: alpha/beta fold hydrolase [Phycisphaerales bacterium]|nr:alpha/beta fold hydrolase [Phycisphaerales bacterium]